MSEKFKIDIILKSSPQHQYVQSHNKFKKYPTRKDRNYNEILYGRDMSAPVRTNCSTDKCIDLRAKIINPRYCLTRPSSIKQKQSLLFTEKCLSILSRKKKVASHHEHRSKMHDMMNNIVEKYKNNAQEYKSETLRTSVDVEVNFSNTIAYNKLTGYEDKIQIYRMLKTTQSHRENPGKHTFVKKEQPWKKKPDITGVRMNNMLKSHPYNIQGVTCISLPISEVSSIKRNSFTASKSIENQQRTLSQSSSRRKIKINRKSPNKFMAFSKSNDPDALYMKKLKSFLDFIFKINFSNKIYVSIQVLDDTSYLKKYKVYIGKGNNSLLIKSLLKRRFWMQIVDNIDEQGINFYWTQNKVDKIHCSQNLSKNYKTLEEKQDLQIKLKNMKTQQQKQAIEMNKKILLGEEAEKVQKYILKNGYVVPFDETYRCSIITNHIPRNNCIGSKKNLFKSLLFYYKDYLKIDPFNYIPKTYSIKNPQDLEFKRFLKDYSNQPNKIWIVKPGQNTNRGTGIKLSETRRVIDLIKKRQKHSNGQMKTYIVQSYIQKPFLYNSRKFDIRHYMMITSVNGILKAYWYKQGYLRTSSQRYTLDDLTNEVIHLTNDAIQKQYEDYQKYEPGNKLSYSEFQRYLDLTYPAKGYNFDRDIIPSMKSIILDVVKANYNILDKNRRQCNFEIYGFDFMVDKEFKPWLIQINYNPCLQMSCPLLSRIIPVMVESSLRIGLDPLLPPMNHYAVNKRYTLSDNYLKNQRYQLIFDESNFNETIPQLYDIEDSDEEEQQYCDEGKQIEELCI